MKQNPMPFFLGSLILGGMVFLADPMAGSPARAEVVMQEIDYTDGEVPLKGYLAFDESIKGKRPGILVVHEWWGLNDYARKRAAMLAELGYTALALDMYGNGKTVERPDEAGAMATQVSQNVAGIGKARFVAALDLLKKQPTVDPDNIAAIGYCFGGGIVLQMARLGIPLKGVVSFHGSLATQNPAQPGNVKAKILVCHGADDGLTTPEQMQAFKDEMDKAGVDYTIAAYKGAKHSFTNPDADRLAKEFDLPIGYNAAADKQSWQDMQAFFKMIFHR